MRSLQRFGTLLGAALTLTLAAEPLPWKFDASESWKSDRNLPVANTMNGLELAVPATPKWSGEAVVYSLREPKSLAGVGAPKTITVNAELVSGGGATMALYLKDAEGEFFAYPQRPLKPGRNQLIWEVERGHDGHWGDKQNGTVDFPVKLEALQLFQYPAEQPALVRLHGSGEAADGGRRPVVRDFLAFDDTARWDIGRELTKTQLPGGLLIEAVRAPEPGKEPVIGRMREVFFDLKEIGSPDAIALDVELQEGTGVNLALELIDAGGENFALRQQSLRPGRQQLLWDLRYDIAGSWGSRKDGKIDLPVRISNVTYFQYPAEKPARVLFHRGLKREVLAPLDAVETVLETGNAMHVLKTGEESKLGFHLINHYPEIQRFDAAVRLYTLTGLERRSRHRVELKPGESTFLSIPWDAAAPRGIWRSELELSNADGETSRRTRAAFAYLTPAGPNERQNPEFEIGLNLRQHGWSKRDCIIETETAALIGAKLLRTGYTWEHMQPEKDRFDFAAMDELVALNARYGMRQLSLIAYTPIWAADPELVKNAKDWNEWNKSAPDPDALERFTEELTRHYRGKIEFFEFWNEPDLDFWRGTADDYLERQARVYRALKRGNPDAKLICGGFAFTGNSRAKPGFQERVLAEGQQDFDFHGFHQHGDYSEYERAIEGPLTEMRKVLNPDKPIFFTETGFYVSNGNYLQQAANVIRKVIFARAIGARGYIWFDLRDDGFLPGYCEHNYGLTTNDWFPKESFAAYNTLNLLLGDATFGGTLVRNARTTSYYFHRNDGQVLSVWKNGRGMVEEPLTVLTDATSAVAVDLFGNETELPVAAGRVTVPVPAEPGFVVLKDAKTAPTLGVGILGLAPGQERISGAPGGTAEVILVAVNPLGSEAKLQLEWRKTDGLKLQNPVTVLTLKPQETAPLKIRLAIDRNVSGGLLRPELSYRLNDGTAQVMTLPVNVATRVAEGKFTQEPQFILNSSANLVSQMEHNPYTAHRVWSGPADQSVRVYLAADQQELRIKVEVEDDVHVKSAKAFTSYMEDGLQLALAIPGQKGHWEFGFAELADGQPDQCTWIHPDGFSEPENKLTIRQQGTTTTYLISIPFRGIGLTAEQLRRGIQFNLLVNENDGEGRDGWMQISPGIGEAKNPERYPFITL